MSIFDLKKGKGKKNDGTDEEKKEVDENLLYLQMNL